MGSSNSKFEQSDSRELLLERLRALELKTKQKQAAAAAAAEKDYVFVDSKHASTVDSKYGAVLADSDTAPSNEISISTAEQWEKELMEDPKNRLALAAFTSNATSAIISSRAAKIADTQTFNIKIPTEGSPVTNQKASGRCWLFASTNVFRIAFMKKYNLKNFQLSQQYLFFWDKLEKANYFLENVLDTLDEPLDSRLSQALMSAPVNDGGQWDMVANLVEKYGLVPHDLYPDAFNAEASSSMGSLITTKLREDALRLRSLAASSSTSNPSILAAKNLMVREIHSILILMLGPPPSPNKEFAWEYYDQDQKYHKLVTTPVKFSKELSNARACGGTDVHRMFSLVNDPRNEYETLLSVQRLGNVNEGRAITYVNVKMSTLKAACIAMLKKGIPVFFGSDVGKYSDSSRGIMDTALFDYELGFNVRLGMSKAERLRTGESAMTHAMVLTGVQVESGKSIRWRVENSWSETAGDKGYFVMTDAWMDEFVYQAVVDPSFVDKSISDVLKQQPKVLPLWDPMGALA